MVNVPSKLRFAELISETLTNLHFLPSGHLAMVFREALPKLFDSVGSAWINFAKKSYGLKKHQNIQILEKSLIMEIVWPLPHPWNKTLCVKCWNRSFLRFSSLYMNFQKASSKISSWWELSRKLVSKAPQRLW